jgi:hypothetical protein
MSSATISKTAAKDSASTAILGVDKGLAGIISISLNGVTYTPVQIKSILQADIDATNAIDATKAAWSKAVADGRVTRAEATAMLRALRSYLIATSGAGAVGLLADFGFLPPKPKKVAVKTKAAAVDKTLATRAARHTMGKNQKKEVKGAPAAAAAPPSPAPVTPASAAAPAPAGGTAGTTPPRAG